MSNILFTTLSTRNKHPKTNFYCTGSGLNLWCTGIHQQEPGAKKILSETRIDKIVIFGSRDTLVDKQEVEDTELINTVLGKWSGKLISSISKDQMDSFSSLRFFVCRIADYLYGCEDVSDELYLSDEKSKDVFSNYYPEKDHLLAIHENVENKDIQVVFVPERSNSGAENLKLLINELRGNHNDESHLYVDMQGGARTAGYVNNALLQLICSQDIYHTMLEQIVATNYDPNAQPLIESKNAIVNETSRYHILDLVSGMNAFFKYGKTDLLVSYINDLHKDTGLVVDEKVEALVNALETMDGAITFCKINDYDDDSSSFDSETVYLITAIQALKAAIKDLEDEKDINQPDYIRNIFDILLDGIKDDLGGLLKTDEIDIISLIEWCIEKKNYITATAIAEDALPSYFVKHSIIYYAKNEDELKSAKEYFQFRFLFRNTDDNTPSFAFNNINHFFITKYLSDIGMTFKDIKRDKNGKVIPVLKPVFSGKFVQNISGPLEHPENYPLKVYTWLDSKDDKAKAISSVKDILVLYFFVKDERNCLAHISKENTVQPETLKKAVRDLIEKIKAYKDKCLNNDFYLEDRDIVDSLEDCKEKRNHILKSEIKRELASKSSFGIFNHFVVKYPKAIMWPISNNPKGRRYALSNVYALSPLIVSFCFLINKYEYRTVQDFYTKKEVQKYLSVPIWDTMKNSDVSGVSEKMSFVKNSWSEKLVRLMIHYYNSMFNGNDKSELLFDQVKKAKYFQEEDSEVSDHDVIRSLLKGINTFDDFCTKIEAWTLGDGLMHQLETEKAALQNSGTDIDVKENQELLNDLFSKTIGCGYLPNIKTMLEFFMENDDDFQFFITTMNYKSLLKE